MKTGELGEIRKNVPCLEMTFWERVFTRTGSVLLMVQFSPCDHRKSSVFTCVRFNYGSVPWFSRKKTWKRWGKASWFPLLFDCILTLCTSRAEGRSDTSSHISYALDACSNGGWTRQCRRHSWLWMFLWNGTPEEFQELSCQVVELRLEEASEELLELPRYGEVDAVQSLLDA
jgi:hypothetical protein